MFNMLYADERGRMFDYPGVCAVGRTGSVYTELDKDEMIPLPEGASLISVPEGVPVGIDKRGQYGVYEKDQNHKKIVAVGALLPQGYTRTYLPGFKRSGNKPLPLFGYSAVGFKDGQIYVAAMRTDQDRKWNPVHYNSPQLAKKVAGLLRDYPDNRILKQLGRCALDYQCFTAQNIFYRRWEGGIPVSQACNANCLGCISLQPAECCPSPQSRINFRPTADEIAEIAFPHLDKAEEGIVSFGQGCEGEPSLEADVISEAISIVRGKTLQGTINMNTNAGNTSGIQKVCESGIDSLRVSTLSAIENTYNAYYCPGNYRLQNVRESIKIARQKGVFVSLNLLTFPGITDTIQETNALVEFIGNLDINMIQIRNLNIDPDFVMTRVKIENKEPLGIPYFIEILKEKLPAVRIGNYSIPVSKSSL